METVSCVQGGEDRGIEALVKYRFITGPSLVHAREPAELGEYPAFAVLFAPAWGAIWHWAALR